MISVYLAIGLMIAIGILALAIGFFVGIYAVRYMAYDAIEDIKKNEDILKESKDNADRARELLNSIDEQQKILTERCFSLSKTLKDAVEKLPDGEVRNMFQRIANVLEKTPCQQKVP